MRASRSLALSAVPDEQASNIALWIQIACNGLKFVEQSDNLCPRRHTIRVDAVADRQFT